MSLALAITDERILIDRCLAGEAEAWQLLYAHCHRGLLAAIQSLLGNGKHDQNLVDEIAARVWYAVVANHGQLLARFDADRGCKLVTYLSVIARDEAARHFRSERRRRRREASSSEAQRSEGGANEPEPTTFSITEFFAGLTPTERQFFDNVLVAPASKNGEADYSNTNIWQLSHRIRRKLQAYLQEEA